jgi:hypothetical protein
MPWREEILGCHVEIEEYLERVRAGGGGMPWRRLGRGEAQPSASVGSGFSRVREYRPALLLWLRASVMHPDRGSEHAIRGENGSLLAF